MFSETYDDLDTRFRDMNRIEYDLDPGDLKHDPASSFVSLGLSIHVELPIWVLQSQCVL